MEIESLTQMEYCITELEYLTKIKGLVYFDLCKKTTSEDPYICGLANC